MHSNNWSEDTEALYCNLILLSLFLWLTSGVSCTDLFSHLVFSQSHFMKMFCLLFTACPGGINNVCNGHGECQDGIRGNGECQCNNGFKGVACQLCNRNNTYGPLCDQGKSYIAPSPKLWVNGKEEGANQRIRSRFLSRVYLQTNIWRYTVSFWSKITNLSHKDPNLGGIFDLQTSGLLVKCHTKKSEQTLNWNVYF